MYPWKYFFVHTHSSVFHAQWQYAMLCGYGTLYQAYLIEQNRERAREGESKGYRIMGSIFNLNQWAAGEDDVANRTKELINKDVVSQLKQLMEAKTITWEKWRQPH